MKDVVDIIEGETRTRSEERGSGLLRRRSSFGDDGGDATTSTGGECGTTLQRNGLSTSLLLLCPCSTLGVVVRLLLLSCGFVVNVAVADNDEGVLMVDVMVVVVVDESSLL